MPRKSDIIQAEEATVASPLRRSTRTTASGINGTPVAMKTRRSSLVSKENDEENVDSKPAPRTRRASSVTTEDQEKKPEPAKPKTRRSSASSEPAPVEEKRPAATKSRRSSAAEEPSETPQETTTRKTTIRSRRNSAQEEKVEEADSKTSKTSTENAEPKGKVTRSRRLSTEKTEEALEELPKRTTRATRRNSVDKLEEEPDIKVSRPNTPKKPRRRLSVTDVIIPLEPITEQDSELAKRRSKSPIEENAEVTATLKKTETKKPDLELSVIKETSFTEESDSSPNRKTSSAKVEETVPVAGPLEKSLPVSLSPAKLETKTNTELKISPSLKENTSPTTTKNLQIKLTPIKKKDSDKKQNPELVVIDEESVKTPQTLRPEIKDDRLGTRKPSPVNHKALTPTKLSFDEDKEQNKDEIDDDSVFVNTPNVIANQPKVKPAITISSGSDGSFTPHLSNSLIKTGSQDSQDDVDLNISNNSDKENIEVIENVDVTKGKPIKDLKSIVALTDTANITPRSHVHNVSRVSNVFRPKNVDFSFVEPMDVDKTLLESSVMQMNNTQIEGDRDEEVNQKEVNDTLLENSVIQLDQTEIEDEKGQEGNSRVNDSEIENKREEETKYEVDSRINTDKVEDISSKSTEDVGKPHETEEMKTCEVNSKVEDGKESGFSSAVSVIEKGDSDTKDKEEMQTSENSMSCQNSKNDDIDASVDFEFTVPSDEEIEVVESIADKSSNTMEKIVSDEKEEKAAVVKGTDVNIKEKENVETNESDLGKREIIENKNSNGNEDKESVCVRVRVAEKTIEENEENLAEKEELIEEAKVIVMKDDEIPSDNINEVEENNLTGTSDAGEVNEICKDIAAEEEDFKSVQQDETNNVDDSPIEHVEKLEQTKEINDDSIVVSTKESSIAMNVSADNETLEISNIETTVSEDSSPNVNNVNDAISTERNKKVDESSDISNQIDNKTNSDSLDVNESAINETLNVSTMEEKMISVNKSPGVNNTDAHIPIESNEKEESVTEIDISIEIEKSSDSLTINESMEKEKETMASSTKEANTISNETSTCMNKKDDHISIEQNEPEKIKEESDMSNLPEVEKSSNSILVNESMEIGTLELPTIEKKRISRASPPTMNKNDDVENQTVMESTDAVHINDSVKEETLELSIKENKVTSNNTSPKVKNADAGIPIERGEKEKSEKEIEAVSNPVEAETSSASLSINESLELSKTEEKCLSRDAEEETKDMDNSANQADTKPESASLSINESMESETQEFPQTEENREVKKSVKSLKRKSVSETISLEDTVDNQEISPRKMRKTVNKSADDDEAKSLASDPDHLRKRTKKKRKTKIIKVIDTSDNQVEDSYSNDKLDKYLEEKMQEMTEEEGEDEDSIFEEESSDNSSNFIDDMAEEGEEDTPSEDSNQISDEGESINTTESEWTDDEDYDDNDSFIADDEHIELLSGDEYDLGDMPEKAKKVEKQPRKQKPAKKSRILVRPSSSSDEEDSQTKKESEISNDTSKEAIEVFSSDKEEDDVVEVKEQAVSNVRRASINIQENIRVNDIQDPVLSTRINQLVNSFSQNINKGDVSVRLSLDYEGKTSDKSDSNEVICIDTSMASTSKKKEKRSKASTSENEMSAENSKKAVKQKHTSESEEASPSKKMRMSTSLNNSTLSISSNDAKMSTSRRRSVSTDDLNLKKQQKKKVKKAQKKAKAEMLRGVQEKTIRRASSSNDLRLQTFNLMHQLLNDVRNRPKRVPRPTLNSSSNTSWQVEDATEPLKPSTCCYDKVEKKPEPVKKIHPKDFRTQMLTNPSHVKRIETKHLLKKK